MKIWSIIDYKADGYMENQNSPYPRFVKSFYKKENAEKFLEKLKASSELYNLDKNYAIESAYIQSHDWYKGLVFYKKQQLGCNEKIMEYLIVENELE